MAQYKVIQDIEAEDKLLGPFSLRQCIYAGGACLSLYLSAIAVKSHAYPFLALFLPIAAFGAFFAWPWSSNQPTEVWALAHIRFLFKPRKRIWDQSGVKNMVTVTAPVKVEKVYTDGLSQTEVRSRLRALADTIDSRGWAIKNANLTMPAQPGLDNQATDRLVGAGIMPQPVLDVDVHASDDILDEHNNVVAQQFDQMINASTQAHREQILEKMRTAAQTQQPMPAVAAPPSSTPPTWFTTPPGSAAAALPAGVAAAYQAGIAPAPVAAMPTPEEQAWAAQLQQQTALRQSLQTGNMQTIAPPADNNEARQSPAEPAATAAPDPSVAAKVDAAIINLASNNDLDVATIARQAHKAAGDELPNDEVVITLH